MKRLILQICLFLAFPFNNFGFVQRNNKLILIISMMMNVLILFSTKPKQDAQRSFPLPPLPLKNRFYFCWKNDWSVYAYLTKNSINLLTPRKNNSRQHSLSQFAVSYSTNCKHHQHFGNLVTSLNKFADDVYLSPKSQP